MPVTTPGRIRRRGRRVAVIVTAVVCVALAATIVAVVVQVAARSPDRVNLGPRVFAVGQADRLAPRIADDGPLLFKDALNRGREIYVQHQGRDDEEGWLAFEAYAPGVSREPGCVLVWDGARERFRDPCGGATFAADGTGLTQYDARVDDGIVVVDLNRRRGDV